MSILPINTSTSTSTTPSPFSLNFFNPESIFSDLLDPFFPPSFPSSLETCVHWKQNSRAYVVRAVFCGYDMEDVLVHIDDDNVLEIRTESGRFMSRFKLPEDGRRDGIEAAMVGGVLSVVIPKDGAGLGRRNNVREIEISGSG
ncbi:17.6 kDa class I heat shock protein [Euphorbia peplus]|nr:17.6 kDa class I heat shock protein [Euphorbia peplus]